MVKNGDSPLDQVLDPLFDDVVGRRVVDFSIDAASQDRLQSLREGANNGTLTAAERDEYQQFVEALDLIALLKLKAKAAMERRTS